MRTFPTLLVTTKRAGAMRGLRQSTLAAGFAAGFALAPSHSAAEPVDAYWTGEREGHAQLSGVLDVEPEFVGGRPPPGVYRIIYAEGGRTGSLTLRTSIPRARLAYDALQMVLIIE